MVAFDPKAPLAVDFRMMASSFVWLYWQSDVLDQTIEWLRGLGYKVISVDAGTWNDAESLDAYRQRE